MIIVALSIFFLFYIFSAQYIPGYTMIKRARATFNVHEDLTLLRDVAHENPFMEPHKWEEIAKQFQNTFPEKAFTYRGILDRVKYLLKEFKREDGKFSY